MKIFNKDGKINFVDENNVFLGYEDFQQCCEDYGWFIADSIKNEIENKDYSEDLENWEFDIKFFEEIGEMVIFRIVKDKEEKFIHLYNVQNGYYSHGFTFKNDKGIIEDGYL